MLMGKTKKTYLEKPVPAVDEEDAATLAAIDEGIADARVGRTVPAEEARKIVTGRELAKVLAKASLSEDEAKAWRRDLRAAREKLKPQADKWRGRR
jgi:predicted transcriptional regulator